LQWHSSYNFEKKRKKRIPATIEKEATKKSLSRTKRQLDVKLLVFVFPFLRWRRPIPLVLLWCDGEEAFIRILTHGGTLGLGI
jgi:hypothetical protein